jgi:hypothetical protein
MRTTKRFTPQVIARFVRQGRGEGIYQDFIPWHRVSRGDPASMGRSHLLHWRGRLRELLSDGELGEQLFATMLPNLDDCMEQFRLTVDSSPHLLSAYCERDSAEQFPGTLALAKRLGIKHPQVYAKGTSEHWRLTTDLVLVFKKPGMARQILALAFKTPDYRDDPRKIDLLRLEREYWMARGVSWLLITSEHYELSVRLTLQRVAAWALGADVDVASRRVAAEIGRQNSWRSQTAVQQVIADKLGSMELAQRALWQSVWHGELPVDLRRGWRPHVPLNLVSDATFCAFNPISSRRTAWN